MKIFQSLLDKALASGIIKQNSIYASGWLAKQMEKTTIVFKADNIINDNKTNQRRRPEIGKMYLFRYRPKLELTLPYYDIFPLIIVTKVVDDGFYGLNFHYLPYTYRAKLLDALMLLANSTTMDDKTRLLVTYQLLSASSRYKYFRPCFKKYLYKHVMSRFLLVDANEWETAMFIPLEKFQSKQTASITKKQVWEDSKTKIRGS